jgi:hypothetical protein
MSMAHVLATPRDFHFEGKAYKVAFRDFAVERAFVDWLEEQARLVVWRRRQQLGEQEYAAQMKGWRQDCAAGDYEYGGELCHRAQFSTPGMQHMLFLKLKKGESLGGAPLDRSLVDRVYADKEKWEELVAVWMEQDFPNPKAPGTQAAPPAAPEAAPPQAPAA